MSAEPVRTAGLLCSGTTTSTRSALSPKIRPRPGSVTVIESPCCSTTTSSACLPSTRTVLSLVSVQRTLTLPLLISTTRLTGLWVSKRYSGMAVLLGWMMGVLVHRTGARLWVGAGPWLSGGWAQTQPVIRRPRLPPNGPCPPNGSLPPTNGRLDRSMSTLIAPSRVADADDVDEPGVERVAGPGRELLGLGLDRLGEPEGDPGDAALLLVLDARGRRRGRRGRGRGRRARGVDHERELAAVEADVDPTGGHLGGDLGGGLRDGLHQRQPGGGVEGEGQPLGGRLGLGAGGLGGCEQVAPEAVDVRRDVHVHHDDINDDVMSRDK